MLSHTTIGTLYLLASFFVVGCRDSHNSNKVNSATIPIAILEPDHRVLIGDLGIEAALKAMKTESGKFTQIESAGRADTVAWFRRQLHSLDLSLFEEDPEIEGIVIVGGRLRFDDARSNRAQVQYLSIIDGRCELKTNSINISISPTKLIEALLSRSEHRQHKRED